MGIAFENRTILNIICLKLEPYWCSRRVHKTKKRWLPHCMIIERTFAMQHRSHTHRQHVPARLFLQSTQDNLLVHVSISVQSALQLWMTEFALKSYHGVEPYWRSWMVHKTKKSWQTLPHGMILERTLITRSFAMQCRSHTHWNKYQQGCFCLCTL